MRRRARSRMKCEPMLGVDARAEEAFGGPRGVSLRAPIEVPSNFCADDGKAGRRHARCLHHSRCVMPEQSRSSARTCVVMKSTNARMRFGNC